MYSLQPSLKLEERQLTRRTILELQAIFAKWRGLVWRDGKEPSKKKRKQDGAHEPECKHVQKATYVQMTLVGHSCGTLLWVTLVENSCGTLLRDTLVGHSCGTLLRDTLSSRTLLWDTLLGHSCRTLLRDTLVGHSYGTLLWDTLVGHSCGTCGTLL